MSLSDLKESLGNARKPDVTHVRVATENYIARSSEYGSDKYERGNFRRPTGGAWHEVPTGADFERFRSYLRAAKAHINETLDAMERHLAIDPKLVGVTGMKAAAYAVDTDATPGSTVGPSLLPHVAPAIASLNMAITQATDCGLLPRDPGTPWRGPASTAAATLAAPKKLEVGARVQAVSDCSHVVSPGSTGVVIREPDASVPAVWYVRIDGRGYYGRNDDAFYRHELEIL